MKRPQIIVALYLLLVFASGVLVGGFSYHLYTASVAANERPRSPEEWRQRYTEEMQTRLKLSQEQVAQLNAILDATRERYRELREKHRPEMKAIQDAQVEQINQILSEEQRAEYARLRSEREKRRGRRPPEP